MWSYSTYSPDLLNLVMTCLRYENERTVQLHEAPIFESHKPVYKATIERNASIIMLHVTVIPYGNKKTLTQLPHSVGVNSAYSPAVNSARVFVGVDISTLSIPVSHAYLS